MSLEASPEEVECATRLAQLSMSYDKEIKKLKAQNKELRLAAKNAHDNAQWTMDANRRQVEMIKEIKKIFSDALEEAAKLPQPQDMKTRLTFDCTEFWRLQDLLQLNCVISTSEESK